MAAVRGEGDDLPARCISLLQEVKDLMEAHKSGPENTDETAALIIIIIIIIKIFKQGAHVTTSGFQWGPV